MDIFAVFAREFYERATLSVAKDLLGSLLCRRLDDGTIVCAAIIEVEAYTADDPACHAYRGLTERTRVMFGQPGYAYVYFIYGMYFCLNVVTEPESVPGAILIRAIDVEGGNGPGKLCRLWNINKSHNGIDLCDPNSPIWIAKGAAVNKKQIGISERIGLSVGTEHLWRFYLKDHPGVSGTRKGLKLARKGTARGKTK